MPQLSYTLLPLMTSEGWLENTTATRRSILHTAVNILILKSVDLILQHRSFSGLDSIQLHFTWLFLTTLSYFPILSPTSSSLLFSSVFPSPPLFLLFCLRHCLQLAVERALQGSYVWRAGDCYMGRKRQDRQENTDRVKYLIWASIDLKGRDTAVWSYSQHSISHNVCCYN